MENSKENFLVSNRHCGLFLLLSRQRILLIGYSHAIWVGDLDEHKSTSRYTFLLNNGARLWKSKKQTCIGLSTIEAEFTIRSVVI